MVNDGQDGVSGIGAKAVDLGATLGEMAAASGYVVAARMGLIGAAIGNPAQGDYREMQRMVPEKMFAFASSGLALARGLGALQRDLTAQAMDMASLALGGVPSAARLARLAEDTRARGSRAAAWPVVVGAAAVKPLHRVVTANARRLGG